jgi:hypothetical protein
MKILKTPEEITNYIQNNIVRYYKTRSLFPFLGAGFTKGLSSRKGQVPDGTKTGNLMKDLIAERLGGMTPQLENLKDFDKIAGFFYKTVAKDQIVDFIAENFTHVRLDPIRTDFINLDWPYIYTLNIDDGIEKASSFTPVLPNKPLNKKYLPQLPLFKLHGDAQDEITYIKRDEGLIFSRRQYLKSLTDNQDLLNIFFEDFTGKNCILIGCSLDNELDLEYLFANNKGGVPAQTDKIYVTSQEPDSLKKISLNDFGINVCLIIQNYTKFYQELNEALKDAEISDQNVFAKYLIKEFSVNSEVEYNKSIGCGEDGIILTPNKINLPSIFIRRGAISRIQDLLSKENLVFIVGRRVSGKTFIGYELARTFRNENVYLFPSYETLDSNLVDSLKDLQNSIIIFDTDTISASDIEEIYYQIENFKARNIRFIFMINSSDRLMLSVPYTRVIDGEIEELSHFFTNQEISEIGRLQSQLGLAKYEQGKNILTNIIRYKRIYRTINQHLDKLVKEFDERTLKVYILNAVFDKIYSSLYRALRLDYDNLKYIIDHSDKALEFEFQLTDIERGQHANYKVITNSQTVLFSALGRYIFRGKDHPNQAAQIVVQIVTQLKPFDSFRTYWKSLVSFDNLNQIFYEPTRGGALNLIFLIYDKLEPVLYEDTHYWLQRGKSIFHLKKNDTSWLVKAIEYTKKPYFDSPEGSRFKSTSSFQIAMIYCRICAIQKFANNTYLNECVDWLFISLKTNEHNHRIINNFLDDARLKKGKNDFYSLCSYLLSHDRASDRSKKNFLLGLLFQSQFSSLR